MLRAGRQGWRLALGGEGVKEREWRDDSQRRGMTEGEGHSVYVVGLCVQMLEIQGAGGSAAAYGWGGIQAAG